MKAKHLDPEYRKMYEETHKNQTAKHLQTPEIIAKRAASNRNRTPEDQRYVASIKGSVEHKQKLSNASNKRWNDPNARANLRKCFIENKHYESRSLAATEYNIAIATVTNRLNSPNFTEWNWC